MSLSTHYELVPLPSTGRTATSFGLDEAHKESLDNLHPDFTTVRSEFVQIHGVATSRVRQSGVYADKSGDIEIMVTESGADLEQKDTIFLLHGFSENPLKGLAFEIHRRVAELNHASRVISFATDGLSDQCMLPSLNAAAHSDLGAMAAARLRGMEQLGRGSDIRIMGISMGSVIAAKALALNVQEERIAATHTVFHSPGIMTRDAAPSAVLVKFVPNTILDLTIQSLSHPLRTMNHFKFRREFMNPKTLAAMGSQAVQLARGMDIESIEEAISHNKVAVIADPDDPLYQKGLWSDLQSAYPDNLQVKLLGGQRKLRRGVGHAAILDDWRVAHDMDDMSRDQRLAA